jgi:hypothetical protein
MQHLMIETMARLIDEAPTAEQAAHLERCEECRATLEAMRADLAALRNLPMIEPPPTEWDQIEAKLLEEGLIRRRVGRSFWSSPAVRVAATIAVFAFGAFSGIAWTDGRTGGDAESLQVARPTSATAPSLIMATEPGTPRETLQLYPSRSECSGCSLPAPTSRCRARRSCATPGERTPTPANGPSTTSW